MRMQQVNSIITRDISMISKLLILPLLLLGIGFSSEGLAAQSCSLEAPPTDAAVSGNHGSYFFVYPRYVAPHYTGCQTMWDELGRKVHVYHFHEGHLRDYSLFDYADGPAGPIVKLCRYRAQSLCPDSPKDCSSYESVKSGILNVEPADEPKVPRDRDPRLK
jgi:hypothetical protein